MTLRTALVIDGDASGAKQAADQTDASLKKVEAAAVAAARAEQLRAAAVLSALRANQSATKEQIAGAVAATRLARANYDAARADEAAAAAARAATAATEANTAAHAANNAVLRQGAAQRANLIFQLNDIFVSLASGMNPGMVLIQQGSQISTIYGPGGLGKALSETGKIAAQAVTKFWPIALAVGAITVGLAGLTHEINRTGNGIQVTMGDTALAVLQTFGDYIYNFVKPAIDGIAQWFSDNWDTVTKVTADVVNWYVRTWVGAVDRIVTTITSIPDALTVAFEAGMQAVSNTVSWTIREIVASINGMIASINGLAEKAGLGRPLGDLGNPSNIAPDAKIDFGGAAAADRLKSLWSGFDQRDAARGQTDYAGQFFSDVAARARENAQNRLAEDGKAKKTAADSDRITSALKAQRTAWDELGDAGASAFEKLADSVLSGGKNILSTIQSIAGDLAKMVFQMAVTNPLKNLFFGGNAVTLGTPSLASSGLASIGLRGSLSSYAGGGFTGNGPRSGGIDGIGGRLSITHPNETIIDHTMGGGRAQAPVNNFFGVPSQPEVRPNNQGGYDYIWNEIDARLSDGRLGRGFASRHGLRPQTRRT